MDSGSVNGEMNVESVCAFLRGSLISCIILWMKNVVALGSLLLACLLACFSLLPCHLLISIVCSCVYARAVCVFVYYLLLALFCESIAYRQQQQHLNCMHIYLLYDFMEASLTLALFRRCVFFRRSFYELPLIGSRCRTVNVVTSTHDDHHGSRAAGQCSVFVQ